jgi:plastocyanin
VHRRPTVRVVRSSVLLLALAAGVLVGCGNSSSSSPPKACAVIHGGRYTLVGRNIAWNTTCLSLAKPGTVVFTILNKDEGTAHNLHVSGPGVNVKTDLEPGPNTQTLTVTLPKAGTYNFDCDIHASMEGQLRVG